MENNAIVSKARVEVEHPHLVMVSLYICAFMGQFAETSMNTALPYMVKQFGVDISIMQWMLVGYMLVCGISLPFASILMKKIPMRKLVSGSIIIFIFGQIISAFAPGFPVLLAGRLIQGIGAGLLLPIPFAVLLEVFPPNKIGAAMGVLTLMMMGGPALSPTFAGLIVTHLPFKWIFLLPAVALFIALIFALKFLVDPYDLTDAKIDFASCILSVLGFGGVVTGSAMASRYGWISAPTLVSLIVGIVALIIYVRRQLGLKNPLLNLRVFTVRQFVFGSILVMLNLGVVKTTVYSLLQYTQNGMLLPVALVGTLLIPGGVLSALNAFLTGRLYETWGPGRLLRIGFGMASVGSLIMIFFLKGDSPIWMIVLCHCIMLIGVSFNMSTSQSLSLSKLPKEMGADGSTVMMALQQVWNAESTAIATSLMLIGMSLYKGTDDAARYTKGFHLSLIYTFILAVIAFIIACTIKTKKKD